MASGRGGSAVRFQRFGIVRRGPCRAAAAAQAPEGRTYYGQADQAGGGGLGVEGAAATTAPARSRATFDTFWVRRVQSLLGVVPIGVFLLFHLYVNLIAAKGPGPYNQLVRTLEGLPLLLAIEVLVLYVPILLHAAIGFHIVFSPKFNLRSYPYTRNWQFWLQRLSAVVAFVFITYHVITLRLIPEFSGGHASFALVAAALHSPWVLALYLIGTVGTVFHFANGLWSFSIHWGLAVGRRAQRVAAYLAGGLFVILSLVLARILLSFA
jgi:succinate dehydrogenase / fumarate reductase, cytochrome b subunit